MFGMDKKGQRKALNFDRFEDFKVVSDRTIDNVSKVIYLSEGAVTFRTKYAPVSVMFKVMKIEREKKGSDDEMEKIYRFEVFLDDRKFDSIELKSADHLKDHVDSYLHEIAITTSVKGSKWARIMF